MAGWDKQALSSLDQGQQRNGTVETSKAAVARSESYGYCCMFAIALTFDLVVGFCLVRTIQPTGSTLSTQIARKELDKTPTPCKEKYPEADISAWVSQHLEGFRESKEPQMILMLGGSGAGKGSFLNSWRTFEKTTPAGASHWMKVEEFVEHGLDEYLHYIPEFKQSLADPSHVYKDAADDCYKGGAIPIAIMATAEIIAKKLNVIYEETGKNLARIQRGVIPPFHQAGYRITAIFIDNEPDIAIERSKTRFQETGRYSSEEYIRETFKGTFDNYLELKTAKEISEAVYCDNAKAHIFCWADGKRPADALVPRDMLGKGLPEYHSAVPKSEL